MFESGQHPIIVGQAAYNSAYGTNFASAGWCNSPTTRLPGATVSPASRSRAQCPDRTFRFKFDTLAGHPVVDPVRAQGHARRDELGELRRVRAHDRQPRSRGPGRHTAPPEHHPLSVCEPGHRDPRLDRHAEQSRCDAISSAADGTQIWKITHNGVDTHPIHFHLYDVQVLNRVTWDNIIIPPEPNELGWKDTVRVSPLEDTIVALRPIVPTLPFGVPDSRRPLNPMMPHRRQG